MQQASNENEYRTRCSEISELSALAGCINLTHDMRNSSDFVKAISQFVAVDRIRGALTQWVLLHSNIIYPSHDYKLIRFYIAHIKTFTIDRKCELKIISDVFRDS